MAFQTALEPNTIYLGGNKDDGGSSDDAGVVNDVASAAITPGMLIEEHDDSGTRKLRASTAVDTTGSVMVAKEQAFMNKGITDAYAAGDLVSYFFAQVGCRFLGILLTGETETLDGIYEGDGTGKLKVNTAAAAGDNRPLFKLLRVGAAVGSDKHCEFRRIQ